MSAPSWVLDCSVAMAWALPDERSDLADRFWSEYCRRGLALVTLDEQLSAAAREAGVGVWGSRN